MEQDIKSYIEKAFEKLPKTKFYTNNQQVILKNSLNVYQSYKKQGYTDQDAFSKVIDFNDKFSFRRTNLFFIKNKLETPYSLMILMALALAIFSLVSITLFFDNNTVLMKYFLILLNIFAFSFFSLNRKYVPLHFILINSAFTFILPPVILFDFFVRHHFSLSISVYTLFLIEFILLVVIKKKLAKQKG